MLRKTKKNDWRLQKDIIESTPGFFPIPRGRDIYKANSIEPPPHAQFGYELPEGKLRGEPSDFEGLFRGTDSARHSWSSGIQDVYDHPRLYKAYPNLKDYTVSYHPDASHTSGYISTSDRLIGVGPHDTPKALLRTLNHEISGHYPQHIEDWPGGTTSDFAGKQLARLPKPDVEDVEKLPLELQRQADMAARLHSRQRRSIPGVKVESKGLNWDMYRREAGEQMAESLARSAEEGGGKIAKHYTVDPSQMYDWRRLDQVTAKYWEQKLLEGLDPKIFGGVPNKR
jgi:hypothetical protein